MKEFLHEIGVSERELLSVTSKAALLRKRAGDLNGGEVIQPPSHFEAIALPVDARSIDDWAKEGCDASDFLDVAQYLFSRGDEIAAQGNYYWTPSTQDGMNRRLIVPFMYGSEIVGYAARAVDPGVEPRYLSRKSSDYLFNNEVLRKKERKYVIVVEGVFDALAIGGVALLGSTFSARQAAWLKSTGQTVIAVPDHDQAGTKLIDAALKHGWHVAFPCLKGAKSWWDADVKDAAEAVRRYGKLWTLLSIVETATADPSVIAVKRRLRP
jgi:5S rRNA maturation endonuclease (ribonuclease M5)